MPEELTESGGSSQGRINPRLRSTRRVRPVPYESCGGLCSFLNSGCFTMCCGYPKTVRRSSSVYYKKGGGKNLDQEEIPESSKKVVKPNVDDGITDADRTVFSDFDETNLPGGFLYISQADIELEEGKSKKIQDGVGVISTTTSCEKIGELKEANTPEENNLESATSNQNTEAPSVELTKEVHVLDVTNETVSPEEVSKKNDKNKSPVQEIPSQDVPDSGTQASTGTKKKPGRRIVSIFQSIRRKSKSKKTDDDKSHRCEDELQNVSKNTNETAIIEMEMIKTDQVCPSDSSTPINEPKQTYAEEEINGDPLPIDQSTPEKNKKKFSWRSSLRREKSKERSVETEPVDIEGNDGLNIDSEKKSPKKTLLGSLKRSPKASPTKENVLFETVESSPERELSPPVNENSDNKTNANKKKKILASLRLSKSDKPEKQAQQTGCAPSLFNSCTNSNIKPNQDRKLSSDSVEVKTIASYEGDAQDREVTPIRIIRNDFFPDEVLDIRKKPNVIQEEAVEKSEKIGTGEVENKINEGSADNSKNTENEQKAEENVTIEKKSPVADKKYGVIEIEDFSESLHTLVDEHDPNVLLVASSDVANDITAASKSCEAAKPGNDNVDNSLPEGTFRTSCSLSIEDTDKDEKDSSDDTLVGSDTLKKSTETLTQANVEPNLKEWVDITGVDDPSFKYIYLKTVQNIQQEDKMKPETSQEVPEVILSSNQIPSVTVESGLPERESESSGSPENSKNNCEKCGKAVEEKGGKTEAKSTPKAKCICTTMTRVRRSIGELEEGNVKSKVAVLAKSERPIILPLRKDDLIISEAHSSPTLGSIKSSKSATPSPIAAKSRTGTLSSTNSEWQNAEEDIEKIVMQGRSSLSNLGLRSDSMASVYSGAGEGRYGTVAVKGQVEFGLQYNYKAGTLEIHVKQCKDLAAVDLKRNRSDPYVKVYLLPDKSKGGKRKTKVKKHTLNPVFDETLKFHISLNGLETRTLWLTVWHSDMFGRNDFLGEVMMALENKVFDDPTPKLYNLQERTEPFDDAISFKGDIIVCLKFVPPDMTVQKKGKRSRGTLQVLVKEAKYLTAYKANGASDPFCKSYLLPDKGRHSKQKTPVVKKTVNPVWNHTFIYDDVTLQELAERCLELTVWDHDRIASNEFLGGVRFCLGTGKHYGKSVEWMDSTGKEMTLWKSMLERPNFWVEGCLSLRPTLDARTS